MIDPNDNQGRGKRRGKRRDTCSDVVQRRVGRLGKYEMPFGWTLEPDARVGFEARRPRTWQHLSAYTGDGHTMVVARTGSGKGRCCALPWLLHLQNSAVVLDVKGEAYAVTAAHREKAFGHRIYVLDPFHSVGGTDTLNPFDLVRPDLVDVDADVLAELLTDGKPPSKVDQFWDNMARAMMLGCIAHIATSSTTPDLVQLRDLLQCDDVVHRIAVLLDTKKDLHPLVRREFATFCNHEGDKVRPSVLSTSQQHLRILGTNSVARALGPSTIKLDDIIRGDKFTIYIVIPPENLVSHGAVLRMWIGVLLTAMTRRKHLPKSNTLFLLDEIAQCGKLGALRQAITLMRGYGVQTLTFWQDLAQLQTTYEDWRSLLNNCAALMTFGAANHEMAATMAGIMGVSPHRLMSLPRSNALVHVTGNDTFEVRRLDYLQDKWLADRARRNPRFDRRDDGREQQAM